MTATFTLDEGMVAAAVAEATDRGAYAAGEYLLQAANVHVPLEEGTLERSGAVSEPHDGAVAVSYDTPYAVRQHEDLTYRHDPGRTAKWLENAANSERAGMAAAAAYAGRLP